MNRFRVVLGVFIAAFALSACGGSAPSGLPKNTSQVHKSSLVYKSWTVPAGSYKPANTVRPGTRGTREIPSGGFQGGCTYTYLNTSGMYDPSLDMLIGTDCSTSPGDDMLVETKRGEGGGAVAVVQYSGCDPSTDSDCSYDVAAAGGPAKAGDPCWSSPGTIGAFDPRSGPASNSNRLFNITQVVQDLGAGTIHEVGWIYQSGDKTQFFQAYPGTAFGVSAGAIVQVSASTDIASYLVQINPLEAAIFSFGTQIGIRIPGLANVRSRPCFTKPWDGTFPA